jgi:excisionase family DNA binding protein
MRSKHDNGHSSVRAALRFFTISDVADFLDVSQRSVRRWIKSGDLPVHHFGAAVRISEIDLRAFVAARREA